MQQEELLEYVKRRGWSFHKEYSDKGVSGTFGVLDHLAY